MVEMRSRTNSSLTVVAYFISRFDKKAIYSLGYTSYAEAFREISKCFGKENNYLKLRRDEFDALTSITRKGWRNRPASAIVIETVNYFTSFTFDQMEAIVRTLIQGGDTFSAKKDCESEEKGCVELSEEEIEQIINSNDETARLQLIEIKQLQRVYDRTIPERLKLLYMQRCQICGHSTYEEFGISICEAHHIEPFSRTQNNNASNILILCPNHHRLVHKLDLILVRENLSFVGANLNLPVTVNFHL